MNPPFVDIHTHTAKPQDDLIQIVNLDLEQVVPKQGYYSFGIHPWEADKADFQMETSLKKLEERLKCPNV